MSTTPAPPERPTVLVVDDEDDLRDIMGYSLRRRGFETLAAGDAHTALAVARDHDGRIDALVTDLGLGGGVSGSQLAASLTAVRPELRVLYVSGWSRSIAVERGLIDEHATVLQKPFTPDQLVAAVNEVLRTATRPPVPVPDRRPLS